MGWKELEKNLTNKYADGIPSNSSENIKYIVDAVSIEFPDLERKKISQSVQVCFLAVTPPSPIGKYIDCMKKLVES